jgi:glycosyltransferase involved in cell wall biosynthesis
MRVLHVIAKFPPSGTERQLAGTIRAATGLWEPTLCVLNPGFELARELADEGVPLIEMEQHRRYDMGRLAELRRVIGSGSFDVVHASLWRCNAIVRACAVGPRRPAVVVAERAVEDFRPARERFVDRSLRPLTDAWIGNSQAVADFIIRSHRAPADRVFVVGNGVDRAVFHPQPGRRPRSPWRIGAAGRLDPQKGFDILLKALPAVLAKAEVELEIVGEGGLRPVLQAAAAGLPARLPGTIATPSGMAEWFRGLDLFVLPSRYEGLPNVVLEALACGIPVVASDAPGVAEATRGAAHLVRPNDHDALARAILIALTGSHEPFDRCPAPSFDQVAIRHRGAFDAAMTHRHRLGATRMASGGEMRLP